MNEPVYYNSPLGMLRIRYSGDSINELSFINEDYVVEDTAGTRELPAYDAPVIKQCIRQLDAYFAGELFEFDIELDQPGTPFQQQVWSGLTRIAYGKTENYMAFSRMLGNTKAIRAVGAANGKNNIAIIVPCHRVIGSNGNLVGYSGELWRKKWLLEHEAKYANGVQSLF